MHFRGFPQPARRSFLLILQVTLALISWTSALQIAYCSPENNGDDQYWYTWMSNGECHDHCVQSNSVFAIIQDKYCWCSNDVPSDTVNTGQCNSACPGYPNDTCGNAAVGLYGYFQIGGMPSGTSGGSSPTTASSLSAETSSSPVDSSTSTRQTSSSTLTSSSITSAPTSSTTSAPKTIIQTEQGVTTTIILSATSTPSGDALGSGSQFRSSGGGLNGGQVAGIVIGCTLGVGALIAAAVFFWLRRRHRRNTEAMSEVGGFGSPTAASKTSNTGIPSRQVSQMSSAGLLSKATRSNTGGFSTRQGAGGNGPETDRNSSHLAVDQRLNPWAIYSNDDSRMSNVSLQDNHDYSRQLRVANPDP